MSPTIDPTTTSQALPPTPPLRRTDAGKTVAEAYNIPERRRHKTESIDRANGKIPDESVSAKSDNASAGKVQSNADYQKNVYGRQSKTRILSRDEADINFQLTREERDVFINAISGNESVQEMSEEEQKLLQKTAERIEKILAAVDTRTEEGRERADMAIKEWYSRLANGKFKAPTDLLRLIQAAALGQEDLTKV